MTLTAKERLQIIINFARMDLDRLRPGDWLNLREDLQAFIVGVRSDGAQGPTIPTWDTGGFYVTNIDGESPKEMTIEAFQALQVEVRTLLADVFPLPSAEPRVPVHFFSPWVQPKIFAVGPGYFVGRGTPRDCTLFVLGHLLQKLPKNSVRHCPECTLPFVRIRKQQYCTRRCTNRANMRAWRQTKQGKAKASAQNHRRYLARVKRIHPKANAARRPHGHTEG